MDTIGEDLGYPDMHKFAKLSLNFGKKDRTLSSQSF